jgi:hypothetical protein
MVICAYLSARPKQLANEDPVGFVFGQPFTESDDVERELFSSDLKILMFHGADHYALFTFNFPLK